MGETKKKVYEALVEGATSGLTDAALYDHVVKRVPKANNKRIVRASLLALSDPDLTDRNILNVIYALADPRIADLLSLSRQMLLDMVSDTREGLRAT